MPKDIPIGSFSFFIALLLGILASGLTHGDRPPPRHSVRPQVTKSVVSETAPQKQSFVPEFRGLPNFEDIEQQRGANKLIDVFETEGLYRESEVIAKTGETWLTLFARDGKYLVMRAKTSVRKLSSVSYPGEELDVRLSFNKPGTPVFAVRNIEGVKNGSVSTVYHRPSQAEIEKRNLPIYAMEEGYRREFKLGEKWYVLRVSKGITRDGTKAGVLVLEHDNRSQVIKQVYYAQGEKVIVGTLYWAGDLDNDGRLDLYFDEFNEKGYFNSELHLSTAAKEGRLAGYVASFWMAGC